MRVPVITYHAVGDGPFPLWTPTDVFDAHLDAFERAGYRTLGLAQVARALSRNEELPENALVLTFDDGYECVHREAFPRLQSRNFTATVFLVSSYCGRSNQWPTQPPGVPVSPLLGWDAACELADSGWEIGAHTCSHAPLSTLSTNQAADEIVASKEAIEARIGRGSPVFAYPYGDLSAAVMDCVRASFEGAAGTGLGFVKAASDPFVLPRIDAFYLTPYLAGILRTFRFGQYLRLRRAIRSVRGRFSRPWRDAPYP